MDRFYVDFLVQDVIREVLDSGRLRDFELNSLKVRDWRGAVEAELPSLESLLAFADAVERRGWTPSVLHDARRLLFGVRFELEAGDVDGLRLVARLGTVRAWALRYSGRDLRPVPDLMRATSRLIGGPGAFRERASSVRAAELSYLASRPVQP